MTFTEQFMNLSGLLTGMDELDSVLGESHRTQLEDCYNGEMQVLYAAYRQAVRQPDPSAALTAAFAADGSGRLWFAATQVIKIWYLVQFDDPGDPVSATGFKDNKLKTPTPTPLLPGQYQRGLIWRIIKAHPPGYSVQPTGYWANKP